jgi:eukaryotic-like serine/threonine-protein kinase
MDPTQHPAKPADAGAERLATALAGKYTIERELGGGGMSRVFLAEETALGRRVVIKVLPEVLAESVNTDRFRREIRVAANLRHPHIVPLFHADEAGGFLYYTMPFIRGESLDARLKRTGPLSVDEAVHLAAEVADALEYAHQQGVVHRDIKPANILLEGGHAVVADFGIARAVSHAATNGSDASLTTTGEILGTPHYMSPEQASGDDVDARSDIYALGCVLHHMLTGQPPFTGDSRLSIIAHRLVDEPPPLDRPDAPPGLHEVLRKALARLPAHRFASAALMRDAVRAVDSRRLPAAAARPPGPPGPTTGAATATASGSPRAAPGSGPIGSLAVLPFDGGAAGADDEYLADGITEAILNKLTRVSGLRVVPRSTVFRYKRRDDLSVVAAELRVRALVTGRVQQRGQTLLVSAELTDAATESQLWGERITKHADDIFVVQEEMAAEIVKSLRLRLSSEEREELLRRYTEDSEAYRAYLRGRYQWAKRTRDGFLSAIEHFQEAIDRDPSYALAYAGMADAYNVLGYYNYQPPRDAYPRAKKASTRALDLDPSLAEAHASLGYTRLFFDWDFAGAETSFRRAIELDPHYASAHQWYAWHLLVTGDLRAMIQRMRTALQLDPLSLIINVHMGYAYYWAGRFEEALEQLRKTIALDPSFALAYWPLGAVYHWQGRADDAIAAFQKLVELTDGVLGLGYLGSTAANFGQLELARDALCRLEQSARTRWVSPLDLALCRAGLGEHDEALRLLGAAVDERVSDLVRLHVLPWPAAVREDPRFAAIARRVAIPEKPPGWASGGGVAEVRGV